MIKFDQFNNWYSEYQTTCLKIAEKNINESKPYINDSKSKISRLIDLIKSNSNSTYKEKLESERKNQEHYKNTFERALKTKDRILEKIKINSPKNTFRKLKNHKLITDINIVTKIENNQSIDCLDIKTKELFIDFNGQQKSIGEFLFSIKLNGYFNVSNLTFKVNDKFDHWHVQYTVPCLGSWQAIFLQTFTSFQLFLFIDTIFHYLLLSDSNHAYLTREKWFESFDKKIKIESFQEISPRSISVSFVEYSFQTRYWSTNISE